MQARNRNGNLLVQLLVDFLSFVPGEDSKHPVLETNTENSAMAVCTCAERFTRKAPHLPGPAWTPETNVCDESAVPRGHEPNSSLTADIHPEPHLGVC